MVIEAIGLGMLVSLFLTEAIGLAAGGIVVPGYIALVLHHPWRVVGTVGCALATFGIVKALSMAMLLYGRRLLVVSIMVGYILGYISRTVSPVVMTDIRLDLATVGYIVPGLIAYWMERQGIIQTLTTMFIASVLTRFVLIAISDGVILP